MKEYRDEFDELREAWEEFTAPFWDAVRRVKNKLDRILGNME